jgi:hypothetical protein
MSVTKIRIANTAIYEIDESIVEDLVNWLEENGGTCVERFDEDDDIVIDIEPTESLNTKRESNNE